MNTVYLGLGTNLGNKTLNLLRATDYIADEIGIFSDISSVYETKPQGYESKNDFLNMVVCVETLLTPEEILIITQAIEKRMGRVKKTGDFYQDRIIDIDIITYNNLILQTENLQLPHPLFHKRLFVLEPFNEIAPDYVHPVLHKKISKLLNETKTACISDKII